MGDTIAISMMVMVPTQQDAVRVSETIGRSATGMALEGYTVSVTYATVKDEEFGEESKE